LVVAAVVVGEPAEVGKFKHQGKKVAMY